MFCSQCGKICKDTQKFCTKCGISLVNLPASVVCIEESKNISISDSFFNKSIYANKNEFDLYVLLMFVFIIVFIITLLIFYSCKT